MEVSPAPAPGTLFGSRVVAMANGPNSHNAAQPADPVPEHRQVTFGFEQGDGDKTAIEDMVKMVDVRAVNELTHQGVVAIAASPNYRAGTIDQADMNDAPFETKRLTYSKDGQCFQSHPIRVNPHGKLCAQAM